MKTLILYLNSSSLEKAQNIENYYGLETTINGSTLYKRGINQALQLGTTLKNEEVLQIKISDNIFLVQTINFEYKAKSIILATGAPKNKPNIKNLDYFEGKGVSYCATCDGFFYKNKPIAVLGNSNYALSEIDELNNITPNITLLTNGLPAPNISNISINTKKIFKFNGTNFLESIVFQDLSLLKIHALFIANGIASSFNFAKKLGIFYTNNNISVNDNMETNIPGIFACGDCTGSLFQISKAVYEGTKAGLQVIKYINSRGDKL